MKFRAGHVPEGGSLLNPRIMIGAIVLATALVVVATPADSASPGLWRTSNFVWGPGGYTSTFALQLTNDAPYGFAFLGLNEGLPLQALNKLSFDAYYTAGSCGGGSPRVSLAIDTDGNGASNGNLNAYAGPHPTYTGCPNGVWSHYDLLDGASRFEGQQLGIGWGITLQQAIAALPPTARALSANFIWDSSWMFPEYSVSVDNLRVNGALLDEPGHGEACSLLAVHANVPC